MYGTGKAHSAGGTLHSTLLIFSGRTTSSVKSYFISRDVPLSSHLALPKHVKINFEMKHTLSGDLCEVKVKMILDHSHNVEKLWSLSLGKVGKNNYLYTICRKSSSNEID